MNVPGGGVRIVWFQERGRLLYGEDRMDHDSCVIIVEFGMLRLERFLNGGNGCM